MITKTCENNLVQLNHIDDLDLDYDVIDYVSMSEVNNFFILNKE